MVDAKEYSIKKTPKQREAVRLIANNSTILLEGGSRCVSGNTIIDGQTETIASLAEIGKPVRVRTSHGYQEASAPFKKGRALLYNVVTDDGRSIEVTSDHRFWDGTKWVKAKDLKYGSSLACLSSSSCPLESNSEPSLLKSFLNARRLKKKGVSFLGRCLFYFRRYGQQLHFQLGVFLFFCASQFCVRAHIRQSRFQPFRVSISPVSNNQIHRSFSHVAAGTQSDHKLSHSSTLGDYPLIDQISLFLTRVSLQTSGLFQCLHQKCQRYQVQSILLKSFQSIFRTFCSQFYQFFCRDNPCFDTPSKKGYVLKKVSSVTATSIKDYYTLTVPSSAQYFANGFLNHNSGKTFIVCYIYVLRALKYPGSRHLMARFRLSHAVLSICNETMPDVLKLLGLTGRVHLNRSLWYYEFPNGSTIWIGGLDDKKRLDNILGREYATIFLNEASQISFEGYEVLISRLNPKKGVKGKYIIDYNPPSVTHWGYLMFHKRRFPDGRPVPDDDFKKLKMNPADNEDNISDSYLYNLSLLSEAKRKRFAEGEYSLESGKLWKRADIRYYPYPDDLPDFIRVVVGVDPSGSVGGDEIGIIVAGSYFDDLGDLKQMTIDDYSLHATPGQWAAEVAAAYHRWMADCVVAEKNFGGDMVESTIKNADKTINVKLITSSRGKIIRAEPISAMYESNRKEIYHRIPFTALEDEMCSYDPEVSQSPNHMDACFKGGTLIKTLKGDTPIKDIKPGDKVLTSRGYRKVIERRNMGIRYTKKYTFTNGVTLICTPDHKVKTKTNAWKNVDKISSMDTLVLWTQYKESTGRLLNMAGSCIVGIRFIIRLLTSGDSTSTSKYGKIQKGKSLKGLLSTISTRIRKTTLSKTLNVFQRLSMSNVIEGNAVRGKKITLTGSGISLKTGINQKMAGHGTGSTVKSHGKKESQSLKRFVIDAAMNLRLFIKNPGSVLANASRMMQTRGTGNAEKSTFALNVVRSIKIILTKKSAGNTILAGVTVQTKEYMGNLEVFDIEVDDVHEYYANGILVHNCVFAHAELGGGDISILDVI